MAMSGLGNPCRTIWRGRAMSPPPDLAMALHIALCWAGRCCWKARRGSARPRSPAPWPLRGARELIRLQCYEGLDAAQAIYEWNYQRQLLAIRAAAEAGETGRAVEERIFSEEFLLERPLLRAIRQPVAPVLLIDEIDRADEEFEAYLLEILSDFQITMPELGTIRATTRPIVDTDRERHARPVGCAAPALHLCPCRLPRPRDGTGDPARPVCPQVEDALRAPDRRLRAVAAEGGTGEETGRGRDAGFRGRSRRAWA